MGCAPRAVGQVRVILADDHVIVRQAVALVVTGAGFEVVGEASDGRAAVSLARDLQPDVAVLDFVMPVLNGLEATREIALTSPRTRCLLLTSRRADELLHEGLRAGIRGYVLKTQPAAELIRAIHEVAAGGVYLGAAKSLSEAGNRRYGRPRPPRAPPPADRALADMPLRGGHRGFPYSTFQRRPIVRAGCRAYFVDGRTDASDDSLPRTSELRVRRPFSPPAPGPCRPPSVRRRGARRERWREGERVGGSDVLGRETIRETQVLIRRGRRGLPAPVERGRAWPGEQRLEAGRFGTEPN